jgi:hypothetical protein
MKTEFGKIILPNINSIHKTLAIKTEKHDDDMARHSI